MQVEAADAAFAWLKKQHVVTTGPSCNVKRHLWQRLGVSLATVQANTAALHEVLGMSAAQVRRAWRRELTNGPGGSGNLVHEAPQAFHERLQRLVAALDELGLSRADTAQLVANDSSHALAEPHVVVAKVAKLLQALAPEGDALCPAKDLPKHLRGARERRVTRAHALVVLKDQVLRWSPQSLEDHFALLVRAGVFATENHARAGCLEQRALMRTMSLSKIVQVRAAVDAAGLSTSELRDALASYCAPQRVLEAALLYVSSGCACSDLMQLRVSDLR